MKHVLLFAGIVMSLLCQAQETEPNISVKKETLYVNDSAVCRIDKKKKGFLEHTFEIQKLDKTVIGELKQASLSSPASSYGWSTLYFYTLNDSVQFSNDQFNKDFYKSKKLFIQRDDIIAHIIARYSLVKSEAWDPAAVAAIKKDYSADLYKDYNAAVEKENQCINTVKTAQPASDAAKAVQAVLVRVDTSDNKKSGTMVYDLMQDGKKLATVTASGSMKSITTDDAEYDYSSGMLDLSGGAPMNYVITLPEGCIVAKYSGEEKFLATWKDNQKHTAGEIKKTTGGVNSRLSYMSAIGALLVKKRYL
jgi:hypothetical protein